MTYRRFLRRGTTRLTVATYSWPLRVGRPSTISSLTLPKRGCLTVVIRWLNRAFRKD